MIAGKAIVVAGDAGDHAADHRRRSLSRLLQGIKGIGPWTAAVILLRGLGRIDVFPGNDSGVRANLARFAGKRVTGARLVEQLGSQRGMLYFCLLLARLDERGEIGRASDVAS